jgi:hypothetical protein
MWASFKSFCKNVWNNIKNAVQSLINEEISVDEFGNEVPTGTASEKAAAKFAAVVIVAAGMFFTLFPFSNEGAVTLGGAMVRLATIMWSGAT